MSSLPPALSRLSIQSFGSYRNCENFAFLAQKGFWKSRLQLSGAGDGNTRYGYGNIFDLQRFGESRSPVPAGNLNAFVWFSMTEQHIGKSGAIIPRKTLSLKE
jgi:hypothetical protein